MPRAKNKPKQNGPKTIAGTRSLSSFVKSICDIMRRSNCASALQYVPELTWILFLRILDAQEKRDREAAEAVGGTFTPALVSPFRWQDWAAPFKDEAKRPRTDNGKPYGWKRQELFSKSPSGDFRPDYIVF
jgi:type I restriction enzyme M protein